MTAPACWLVLPDGTLQVPVRRVDGLDGVISRAIVRLVTVAGSWKSDRALGCVDVDDAIRTDQRYDGQGYALAVREQLALIPGVLAVSEVRQVVTDDRRLSLRVEIRVDVGDGPQTVALGSSPYGDGDPVAWYVLTRGLGGPISRGF